jgi:hypothetical protein
MPWGYIRKLLGSGLHWGKTQEELQAAIAQAEQDGMSKAAEHIRIILRLRNKVMMEKENPAQGGAVK